jgi:hypothetical protein
VEGVVEMILVPLALEDQVEVVQEVVLGQVVFQSLVLLIQAVAAAVAVTLEEELMGETEALVWLS